MHRSRRIFSLLKKDPPVGLGLVECGIAAQKKRSSRPKIVNNNVKDIPEYVDIFDKGDWEKLDAVLRTPSNLVAICLCCFYCYCWISIAYLFCYVQGTFAPEDKIRFQILILCETFLPTVMENFSNDLLNNINSPSPTMNFTQGYFISQATQVAEKENEDVKEGYRNEKVVKQTAEREEEGRKYEKKNEEEKQTKE